MLDRLANPRRRIWRRGPTPSPQPTRPDAQARRDAIIYRLAYDAKEAGFARSWIQLHVFNPRDSMTNQQLRQVRRRIAQGPEDHERPIKTA